MNDLNNFQQTQIKQREYLNKLNTELEKAKTDKEKIYIYEKILEGVKEYFKTTIEISTLVQKQLIESSEGALEEVTKIQDKYEDIINNIISINERNPKNCRRLLRKLAKERM